MEDRSAQMIACIPRLRRYAQALTGNRANADDLVQDTMERGWNRLPSWRAGSNMRAWLFEIMHNLYIDHLRKFAASAAATDVFDENTPEPFTEAHPSGRLEMRDLESALKMLPVDQREVLLLVALEEMSYEEVSLTLRIPLGTVMSRLSRARERLRANMDGRPVVVALKVVK